MSPLTGVSLRAVTQLLQHEPGLVVRLAAAQTLKDAVDDFEFCPESFLPFLPTCFSQLFRLLQEARECDTKMQASGLTLTRHRVIGGMMMTRHQRELSVRFDFSHSQMCPVSPPFPPQLLTVLFL